MPKSRLRGGAKAHRKRVQQRNETMVYRQRQFQYQYQAELERQMEKLKAEYSGLTETDEVTTDQPLDIKL
jgi:hypothetical protein